MILPDAAVEAAAEAMVTGKWIAFDNGNHSDLITAMRVAIEAAMPAIREALAQELIKNGPVLNYELNQDGTEDNLRAAYVEGHRDAVGIILSGTQ